MSRTEQTIGQIAYNAYFHYSGGHSLVSGMKLPEWSAQNEMIRGAWETAAEAVATFLEEEETEGE